MEPVASVDIGSDCLIARLLDRVSEFFHKGRVAVAENTIVEMLLLEPLLEVDDNAFAVVAKIMEHILAGMLALIAVAPAVGDTESKT